MYLMPRDKEKLFVVVAADLARRRHERGLKLNGETPELKVDPETYRVTVNGEEITSSPAETVPLAQRYALF